MKIEKRLVQLRNFFVYENNARSNRSPDRSATSSVVNFSADSADLTRLVFPFLCTRLARGKFELTNQDSAGEKSFIVLTLM